MEKSPKNSNDENNKVGVQIVDLNVEELFSHRYILFKIETEYPNGKKHIKGMVNRYTDYEKRLYTHLYNPLLYIVDVPTRLAYLYGCLNTSYKITSRITYHFYWRRRGEKIWNVWFIVHPYLENIGGKIHKF
jgi:hypothetical protein